MHCFSWTGGTNQSETRELCKVCAVKRLCWIWCETLLETGKIGENVRKEYKELLHEANYSFINKSSFKYLKNEKKHMYIQSLWSMSPWVTWHDVDPVGSTDMLTHQLCILDTSDIQQPVAMDLANVSWRKQIQIDMTHLQATLRVLLIRALRFWRRTVWHFQHR